LAARRNRHSGATGGGTGHHFSLPARAVPIPKFLKIRKRRLDTSGKSVLLISTSFEEGYRDESFVGKKGLSVRPCRYSGSSSARGSRFWQVARLRIDDDRFACCPCLWCDYDIGSKQGSNACNRLIVIVRVSESIPQPVPAAPLQEAGNKEFSRTVLSVGTPEIGRKIAQSENNGAILAVGSSEPGSNQARSIGLNCDKVRSENSDHWTGWRRERNWDRTFSG
jgi:hypothetical protein